MNIEGKDGRILSVTNYQKLCAARQLMQEVIDSHEQMMGDPTPEESGTTSEPVKSKPKPGCKSRWSFLTPSR